MRRFNLIVFCALFLFVDDNSVAEAHIKNYIRNLISPLKELKNLRHGILPGTLWCGWGDIARDNSELGVVRELDMCCRAHDGCADYISFNSEKYGLRNRHICRRSLCECELQFYNCLNQLHSFYAGVVGRIYFTKCRKCFRTYYSIEECSREGLGVNEGRDPAGGRVFCAKLEQNPRWWRRHNATLPKIDTRFEDWDDNEPDQPTSSFYSEDDEAYFDEDDPIYEP